MNIQRPLASLACLCLSLGMTASSVVTAPRIGLVRYADGGIYPLYGVTGNYVVGSRFLDAADGLSSSQGGGLVVRQGRLMLIDSNLQTVATFEAGSDKPTVAIGKSLESAIAWLPAHHLLVHWNGAALQSVAVADSRWSGKVIGLEKSKDETASLLLNGEGGSIDAVKVALNTGAVLSTDVVVGVTDPVFRDGDKLLWLNAGKLHVTSVSTGTVRSVPTDAQDLTFERLSDDAIHLHSTSLNRDWLLEGSEGRPGDQPVLYQLPSPPSGAAK